MLNVFVKLAGTLLFLLYLTGGAAGIPALRALGSGFVVLFAAAAATDWDGRTKPDRRRYVVHMLCAGAASSLMASLLFQGTLAAWLQAFSLESSVLEVDFRYVVMGVLLAGGYMLLDIEKEPRPLRAAGLAALLSVPGVVLEIGGTYVLSGYVSMFYSIAWWMAAVYLWQTAKPRVTGLMWGLLMGPAFLLYVCESRFGVWAGALFIVLYALRRQPSWACCGAIILWSALAFGMWRNDPLAALSSSAMTAVQLVRDKTSLGQPKHRAAWNRAMACALPAAYLLAWAISMLA